MLENVDLDRRLSKARWQELFPPLQERLRGQQYELLQAEIPTVIVFEGWDAAGKGITIHQLGEGLDPHAFRAWPGSAPSELERRYHFLWRYQLKLPEDGRMVLFDHSWYSRVLVECVERLTRKKAWRGVLREDVPDPRLPILLPLTRFAIKKFPGLPNWNMGQYRRVSFLHSEGCGGGIGQGDGK